MRRRLKSPERFLDQTIFVSLAHRQLNLRQEARFLGVRATSFMKYFLLAMSAMSPN